MYFSIVAGTVLWRAIEGSWRKGLSHLDPQADPRGRELQCSDSRLHFVLYMFVELVLLLMANILKWWLASWLLADFLSSMSSCFISDSFISTLASTVLMAARSCANCANELVAGSSCNVIWHNMTQWENIKLVYGRGKKEKVEVWWISTTMEIPIAVYCIPKKLFQFTVHTCLLTSQHTNHFNSHFTMLRGWMKNATTILYLQ